MVNLYKKSLITTSHSLQNTHVGKRVTSACIECAGYNNNLVRTARSRGTSVVVVKRLDCINKNTPTTVKPL